MPRPACSPGRAACGCSLGRRAARIFPLYWVATTGVLLVAFAIPHALSEPLGGGIGYILASYFFIPWQRPDGFIQPVFRLGWTLNYELLFYSIFALFLVLPRRWATACVTVVILALAAAGVLFRPSIPQFLFWTDPIIVEFAVGMLVATLLLADVRLDMWARVALAAAGVLMLFLEGRSDGPWRLVTYGVPATLFLAAAVLGRPGGGEPSRLMRLGVLLGECRVRDLSGPPVSDASAARGLGPAALDGDGGHRVLRRLHRDIVLRRGRGAASPCRDAADESCASSSAGVSRFLRSGAECYSRAPPRGTS